MKEVTDKTKTETAAAGADTTNTLPPTTVPVEIDDLAAFALPPGQEAVVVTQKVITQVPVRKPSREQWVRTSRDMETWRPWPLLELKEDGDIYLVAAAVHNELAGEPAFVAARLVPAVTDGGVFFFWPIRLPDATGKLNSWHESAAAAADLAREQWVRIVANRGLGGYDTLTAKFDREPQWPETEQNELLKIAFRGKQITSIDHPILRRLKGYAA
jgi:hypothetical protein